MRTPIEPSPLSMKEVAPGILGDVHVSENAPLTAFGAPNEGIKGAIELNDEANKIFEQQKKAADFTRVLAEKNQYTIEKDQMLDNIKAESTGVNADSMRDRVVEGLTKLNNKYGQNLQNREQSGDWNDFVQKTNVQAMKETSAHMAQQHEIAKVQEFATNLKSTVESGVKTIDDPEARRMSVSLIEKSSDDYSKIQGYGPAKTELLRRTNTSLFVGTGVQNLIDQNKPQEAKKLLEDAKTEKIVDTKTYDSSMTKLKVPLMRADVSDWVLGNASAKTPGAIHNSRFVDANGNPKEENIFNYYHEAKGETDGDTYAKEAISMIKGIAKDKTVAGNQAKKSWEDRVQEAIDGKIPYDKIATEAGREKYIDQRFPSLSINTNMDYLQKAYSGPTASEPGLYNRMDEHIQDGGTSEKDILDHMGPRGQLSGKDGARLLEKLRNFKLNGKDYEKVEVQRQARQMFDDKYGPNTKEADTAYYSFMKDHGKDDTPKLKEAKMEAEKQLKSVAPSSSLWHTHTGTSPMEEESRIVLEKRIGADAIKNIERNAPDGMTANDMAVILKKEYGEDALEVGKPVYNAIQYLAHNKKKITAEQIKTVLDANNTEPR